LFSIGCDKISLQRVNAICNSKLFKEKGIVAVVDGDCKKIFFQKDEVSLENNEKEKE